MDFSKGEISWTEAATICEDYKKVLLCEQLGHPLHIDKNGTLRWAAKPEREKEIMESIGAKDLDDVYTIYYDQYSPQFDVPAKNNDLIRELYKCRGYSLSGFWEVFYWDWNNEHADKARPQVRLLP